MTEVITVTPSSSIRLNRKERLASMLQGVGEAAKKAYRSSVKFTKKYWKQFTTSSATLGVSALVTPGLGSTMLLSSLLYLAVRSIRSYIQEGRLVKERLASYFTEGLLWTSVGVASFVFIGLVISTCPYLIGVLGSSYVKASYILMA